MRNLRRSVFAGMCTLWYGACGATPARHNVEVLSLPIIGGEPAPDRSGIAQVSHAQGETLCSGVLIAPDLVLTAKHCVFRSSSLGDQPLSPAGFRIGFGTDVQHFAWRGVSRTAWIGMPNELSVETAVAAGEDIAVLSLEQPAPGEETLHDVALDFVPVNRENVHLAGYGITDAQSGVNGVRAFGSGQVTGYDAATGIVQLAGDSVCFGDSGGPVLSEDDARVFGVLGQVGGSSTTNFCDIGLSFAATAANSGVRRLLAKECASVGGCGPSQTPAYADVGAVDDGGDRAQEMDAGSPAGAGDAAIRFGIDISMDAGQVRTTQGMPRSQHAAACCSTLGFSGGAPGPLWLSGLPFSGLFAWRKRRGFEHLPKRKRTRNGAKRFRIGVS
jgi:hypothetical protein